MNLVEFMEKFLPEYNEKSNEVWLNMNNLALFYNTYFPEALENFKNIVCEKQVEICSRTVEFSNIDHEIEECKMSRYVEMEEL